MTGLFIYNNLYIYLFVAIFLLCCGVLGIVYRRTLIGMLISSELIMAGAGLNFVSFNRFVAPDNTYGFAFTLFIMGLAATEAAIVLGIIILVFRRYKSIESSDLKEMKD